MLLPKYGSVEKKQLQTCEASRMLHPPPTALLNTKVTAGVASKAPENDSWKGIPVVFLAMAMPSVKTTEMNGVGVEQKHLSKELSLRP